LTKYIFYDLINNKVIGNEIGKDRMTRFATRLMNIDELADYLRIQRQTIYNWLNQGKIAGIKVGGVWRFDRKDVDDWLRSRRRSTKTGDK
jgi:excisionase family DNA binding protein